MAMIRARISDELKKEIQSQINTMKENSRGGTEINLSTIIRYSLERYLEEQRELDKEIITLKFDLNGISHNRLKRLKQLKEVTEKLPHIFDVECEETMSLVKNCFRLNETVEYNIYKQEEIESEKTRNH